MGFLVCALPVPVGDGGVWRFGHDFFITLQTSPAAVNAENSSNALRTVAPPSSWDSFLSYLPSPQPAKSFQTPVLEPQLLSLQKAMLGMTVLSQRPVADILVSKVLQGQEERLAEGTGTRKQDRRYSGL